MRNLSLILSQTTKHIHRIYQVEYKLETKFVTVSKPIHMDVHKIKNY